MHRGDLAVAAFLAFRPKVVVLDLMLPGQSGLHVCREIRSVSDTPIVILTAKEDDLDHILGLESGADDYVIKPIKPPVLLARLRALQRRQVPDSGVVHFLEFGQLSIDRSCREVRLAGEIIEMTTMEFELLWLLASAAGNTLSRDDILNRMRGIAFDGLNRSVDVYISSCATSSRQSPRTGVHQDVWGRDICSIRLRGSCRCCVISGVR